MRLAPPASRRTVSRKTACERDDAALSDVAATRRLAAPPASARWASAAVRSGRSVAPSTKVLPPPSRSRSGGGGGALVRGVPVPEPAAVAASRSVSWSLWIWTKVQLHSKWTPPAVAIAPIAS